LTQLGVLSSPVAARICAAVAWHSPRFGLLSGSLLMAPGDGWVLLQGEHTPDLFVWVREDQLYAAT